jgi:hypothetical protein
VFTDDDAVPRPGWLAALLEAHRAAPRAGLGGRTEPLDQANAFSRTSARIIELAAAGGANGAGDAVFFASNNLALPAEGYRELSGFDERLRVSEDRDICSRWLESGRPLLKVPGAVIQHRFPSRLPEYVATQFRYGRGARDHHRLRSARTSRGGFEPSFYARRVVPAVTGAVRRGELAEAALLVAWQTANAAGFAVGGFARDR